jgi:hypothetical protein
MHRTTIQAVVDLHQVWKNEKVKKLSTVYYSTTILTFENDALLTVSTQIVHYL